MDRLGSSSPVSCFFPFQTREFAGPPNRHCIDILPLRFQLQALVSPSKKSSISGLLCVAIYLARALDPILGCQIQLRDTERISTETGGHAVQQCWLERRIEKQLAGAQLCCSILDLLLLLSFTPAEVLVPDNLTRCFKLLHLSASASKPAMPHSKSVNQIFFMQVSSPQACDVYQPRRAVCMTCRLVAVTKHIFGRSCCGTRWWESASRLHV